MKKTAEETLVYLKGILELNLRELYEVEVNNFIHGERTAYVECLEILQRWEYASAIGLTYNIEEKFPI